MYMTYLSDHRIDIYKSSTCTFNNINCIIGSTPVARAILLLVWYAVPLPYRYYIECSPWSTLSTASHGRRRHQQLRLSLAGPKPAQCRWFFGPSPNIKARLKTLPGPSKGALGPIGDEGSSSLNSCRAIFVPSGFVVGSLWFLKACFRKSETTSWNQEGRVLWWSPDKVQ